MKAEAIKKVKLFSDEDVQKITETVKELMNEVLEDEEVVSIVSSDIPTFENATEFAQEYVSEHKKEAETIIENATEMTTEKVEETVKESYYRIFSKNNLEIEDRKYASLLKTIGVEAGVKAVLSGLGSAFSALTSGGIISNAIDVLGAFSFVPAMLSGGIGLVVGVLIKKEILAKSEYKKIVSELKKFLPEEGECMVVKDKEKAAEIIASSFADPKGPISKIFDSIVDMVKRNKDLKSEEEAEEYISKVLLGEKEESEE